jgi:hypothetical protein
MPWQCDVSKRCKDRHIWHDAFTKDVDVKMKHKDTTLIKVKNSPTKKIENACIVM